LRSFTILLCLISLVQASCTTLSWNGFLAFVSVDTSGSELATVKAAKAELIEYIESLGFEKSVPPAWDVEPRNWIVYRHPDHNVVYYNLFFDDPTWMVIEIRDGQRIYPRSEGLRKEVDALLLILRNYFGDENITFEQESTFLA